LKECQLFLQLMGETQTMYWFYFDLPATCVD
jgi:hypothetical protein